MCVCVGGAVSSPGKLGARALQPETRAGMHEAEMATLGAEWEPWPQGASWTCRWPGREQVT